MITEADLLAVFQRNIDPAVTVLPPCDCGKPFVVDGAVDGPVTFDRYTKRVMHGRCIPKDGVLRTGVNEVGEPYAAEERVRSDLEKRLREALKR